MEVFLCGFVLLLLFVVGGTALRKKKRKDGLWSIPGPDISGQRFDHNEDILHSGSLPLFATEQHNKYGPIIQFKWNNTAIVSTATAQLFQQQSKLFNRPRNLFEFLEPVIGKLSIQFARDKEGKKRHATYSQFFQTPAKFYPQFMRKAAETVRDLSVNSLDCAQSLRRITRKITVDNLSQAVFGNSLSQAEKEEFARLNDWAWIPSNTKDENGEDNCSAENLSKAGIARMQELVKKALGLRKNHANATKAAECLLDTVISYTGDSWDMQWGDGLTLIIGGLHATNGLLFWTLYHLAVHPDVQKRVQLEIDGVVGSEEIDLDQVDRLTYLKQVVNESMRLGGLVTLVARYSDEDFKLDGHTILAGTTIMHNINVAMRDPKEFPYPFEFNPDNFSPENVSERHPFAFKPFGFGGNRVCPGSKFALHQVYVTMALLLKNFTWRLPPGQQTIRPTYAAISRPDHDVDVVVVSRMNN